MKKVRIISVALISCMTFGLAACGDKGTSTNPNGAVAGVPGETTPAETGDQTTLTLWGHQENAMNAKLTEITENFEAENPDIHIDLQFFPYDDFESKVQTSLSSKEGGADIYEMWGGWGIDYAPTGALAEVPKDMAQEVYDQMYPCTYGALVSDDKLYGIPMEFNIESGGLLVNKSILQAAGLEIPVSWNELRQDAVALTQSDGDIIDVKGFDFVNWDSTTYLFLEMILSQGAEYMADDGKFDFTTPEAQKAWQEMVDMISVDKVSNLDGLAGGDALEGYQLLYANQAALCMRGPWVVAEGTGTFGLKYDEDFTYAEMPWYGDQQAFAAESGWSIAVNAAFDKQEAAFRFLQYFFQDDVILDYNIACSQIPSKKNVAQNPNLLASEPYAAPLIKILDKGRFIGQFNTDLLKEQISIAFQNSCNGNYGSTEEALSDLTDKCNAFLEK